MANTYTVLAANLLTTTASTITFTSINQTYSDLCLILNAQTNYANFDDTISVTFNSNASNYYRVGISSGSAIVWPTGATSTIALCAGNQTTEQFGSTELWISRYSSSAYSKRIGSQAAANGFASPAMYNYAAAWNDSSAITSITLTPASGIFTAGSSFYLYGIADS